jgi:hypothetical protein
MGELTAEAQPSLALLVHLELLELGFRQRSSRCAGHRLSIAAEQPSLPCSSHPDLEGPLAQLRYSIAGCGNRRADLLPEQSVAHLLRAC